MRVLATASAGLNRLLASECGDLGLRPKRVPAHGVELDLDWEGVARGLVHLRIAQRLLIYLTRFECDDSQSLYDGARAVPWHEWMDAHQTLAVAASGQLPKGRKGGAALTHHVFASQRVKDAIVDSLRDRGGERPDVDLRAPDLRVVARFHGDACSLWLDPCGEALHRRGYRLDGGEAPLRETLAAGVVRASGWDGRAPLIDPMCGSGTLLIEAVSAALGLAPGAGRTFGGERWRHQGAELAGLLASARQAAQADNGRALADAELDVQGVDIDPAALDLARSNLQRAGLSGQVQLRQADATRLRAPARGTVLVTNPPYGQRIGGEDVETLYAALGRQWGQFKGCEGHIIDGHEGFDRAFGLRWTHAMELTNGSLPVTLRRYEFGDAAIRGGGAPRRRGR